MARRYAITDPDAAERRLEVLKSHSDDLASTLFKTAKAMHVVRLKAVISTNASASFFSGVIVNKTFEMRLAQVPMDTVCANGNICLAVVATANRDAGMKAKIVAQDGRTLVRKQRSN